MPTSKAKLQVNAAMKGHSDKHSNRYSPNSRPLANAVKSSTVTECSASIVSSKDLQELKTEQANLVKQLNQIKCEQEELDHKKKKQITELESDITEKSALLEECIELNGGPRRKKKKKFPTPQNGEEIVMPYDIESIKRLGSLAGRLIRELVGLRRSKRDYSLMYMDELHRVKVLDELLYILSRPGKDHRRGRVFYITRIKELEKKNKNATNTLEGLKTKYNENLETGWEQAASKYAEQVKQLTNDRAKVQREYLEKESKLKDLHAKTMLLDKEISSKKSRLERQTEANNKQIFSSTEFTELMNQRDILLTRIEKAINVIEDTRAAHDTVVTKINEVHLDLTRNQKRVEELKGKIAELKVKNEEEKIGTIGTGAIMDYVSQELNTKNGILLNIEVNLEELQNQKEMLEKNLQYSQLQKEILSKETSQKEKRITELQKEYFE